MDPELFSTTTDNTEIIFVPGSTTDTNTFYVDTRTYPTTTSSYVFQSEIDLDKKPLEHYLKKEFPWVLNVTRVYINGGISIQSKRVEIYITVSPTHHTELMNPTISNIVEEKMSKSIKRLVKAIYPEVNNEEPHFVFSPEYSQTILDLI